MSAKVILILCAQALLVKSALSQCTTLAAVADFSGRTGRYGMGSPYGLASSGLAYDGVAYPGAGLAGRGIAYNGLNAGCSKRALAGRGVAYDGVYAPAMEFTATRGGGLPVSSASAIAPVGISVASENVYEGALSAIGELPFVGTVALEGVLPTAGAGAVNHACGNGRNAMISETAAYGPGAAYSAVGGIAPAAAAYGYRAGFGDRAYPAASFAGRSCGCRI